MTGVFVLLRHVELGQSSVQLATFGATPYIGRLVAGSMIRELGPVLAGLMVAGRVGSGIAAQLGSILLRSRWSAPVRSGSSCVRSPSGCARPPVPEPSHRPSLLRQRMAAPRVRRCAASTDAASSAPPATTVTAR